MKFIIYFVGVISGIAISYLYFESSTSDDSVHHYQKQLMEKSEEVESLSQKNTEIVRQNDILTEGNAKLSLDVENLQIQLSEYK